MLMISAVLVFGACGKKEIEDTDADQATETAEAELTELGAYKGIEVEAVNMEATEEEIQSRLDYFQKSVFLEEIEGRTTVEEGDIVNIAYVGRVDGEEFEGGSSESHDLEIGSGAFIDGFEEGLIGKEKGGTYDLDLQFPEEYTEELAGKAVVFEVTVNKIQKEVNGELTDEFVEKHLGYESVEAYKEAIIADIEAYKVENKDTLWEENVVWAVIDNSTFANEADEVAELADSMMANYEYYAMMYGMDMESFVFMSMGLSLEEFEEECNLYANYTVKKELILSAIAKAEGLTYTDDEYTAQAETVMASYGYETLEELEEAVGKEVIAEGILQDKALVFLLENAVEK